MCGAVERDRRLPLGATAGKTADPFVTFYMQGWHFILDNRMWRGIFLRLVCQAPQLETIGEKYIHILKRMSTPADTCGFLPHRLGLGKRWQNQAYHIHSHPHFRLQEPQLPASTSTAPPGMRHPIQFRGRARGGCTLMACLRVCTRRATGSETPANASLRSPYCCGTLPHFSVTFHPWGQTQSEVQA